MEKRKTYIVADLVKELNLPRTTITDWLSRFSDYLESKNSGKRKCYFESTLKILQEIAELRNSGKNPADIELELASRHPLQAEVASDESTVAGGAELIAPKAQKQAEELARTLGENLKTISIRLEENKVKDDTGRRRSFIWQLLSIVLILLLGIALIFVTAKISKMLKSQGVSFIASQKSVLNEVNAISLGNNRVMSELRKSEGQITAQDKKLEKLSVMIDRNSKSYEENIGKVQKELASQQKSFKAMLDKYSADLTKQKEAEMALLKDNMARDKLQLLKKIDLQEKEIKHKNSELDKLRTQVLNQSETIRHLAGERGKK